MRMANNSYVERDRLLTYSVSQLYSEMKTFFNKAEKKN